MTSTLRLALVAAALVLTACAGSVPNATGTQTPPQQQTAANCLTADTAIGTVNGKVGLGSYTGLKLPGDFNTNYSTEAEVTARFKAFYTEGTNWACVQKFYPEAVVVARAKGSF